MFQKCTRLKYIEVPQNVKEIQWGAFRKCENIIGISLPEVITNIPLHCFLGCKSLQSFKFSVCNKITDPYINIGAYAFHNCISLVVVDLSSYSVYSIGKGSSEI